MGETRKYQLVEHPKSNTARFVVLGSDGKPRPKGTLNFEWAKAISDRGSGSGLFVDENGRAASGFDSPGLWRVGFYYRDSQSILSSRMEAPFYKAAAVVPACSLLANAPPMRLTARRHEPGVLIVQLEDIHGRPANGVVLMDCFMRQPDCAGSTDENGLVRFEGLQAWGHELEAHIRLLDRPNLGTENAPFPEDKEMIGLAVPFPVKVKTDHNRETRVTIQPKKVGYIRGVIHLPKNSGANPYRFTFTCNGVYCNSNAGTEILESRCDAATGEFVIGPLPEGSTTVCLIDNSWLSEEVLLASKDIEVRSDRVGRIEFTAPASVKRPRVDPLGIRGQVLLSDGKTPAAWARLAVFYPIWQDPRDFGETDVRGQIHMRETLSWSPDRPTGKPGSPKEPVIVAWLPGACGATITPLTYDAKEPLKIVLPPALRIQGKVTVGGKAIDGRQSQFRVRAAYEGKGKIDDLLSIDVSAEADGHFELAGLTPGTYQIQAAMDGIWLSRTTRLTIKPDEAPPQTLALDIGDPGAPSILELVYPDGKTAPGRTVQVVRPQGPLTDLLWPAEFTADGAGILHVPPLEVGTHTITVKGAAKDQLLVIPSLLEAATKPVKVRVVVE